MRWRGLRMPRDAATWRRFLFQACLNSVIPWTLIAWAERSLDAGLATILNSTSPIFTFFLTLAVTRHEAVSCAKAVRRRRRDGRHLPDRRRAGPRRLGEQLVAEIATVVATICYAGAAIFGRGFKGLDPMAPAAGSLLCGAAILVPVSLVVDQPWTLAPSMSSLLALLALAVFSTALAFVIYFRLIQTLGSVGTTAQAYLRVPIGVAIGVAFLGERLTPTAWIGLACVVRRRRRDDDSGAEAGGAQSAPVLKARAGSRRRESSPASGLGMADTARRSVAERRSGTAGGIRSRRGNSTQAGHCRRPGPAVSSMFPLTCITSYIDGRLEPGLINMPLCIARHC